MASPREWWRRAAGLVKDKRSLCMAQLVRGRRRWAGGGPWNAKLEAAVIRATSHDERAVDYKSAGRVFAWARAAPSFVDPLMWALARRASRTRSWAVALKSLLLAHGLLLTPHAPSATTTGRLPFDLSDFRDRSPHARGFSAFVRAYFDFLDHRSLLLDDTGDDLQRVERLQKLLELLMQIRPYADGMDVGLVLEAMDCAVIEIFEVYSGICNGIACFLVSILGSQQPTERRNGDKGVEEEEAAAAKKRRAEMGVRILRRASEQSVGLASYFEVCRALGVLNATEFPPVERVPEEDIRELERLVLEVIPGSHETSLEEEEGEGRVDREEEGNKVLHGRAGTVVTEDWVVFDDEPGTKGAERQRFGNDIIGYYGKNPFVDLPQPTPNGLWELMVQPQPPREGGVYSGNNNLIELV